jgi:hypothetical protein
MADIMGRAETRENEQDDACDQTTEETVPGAEDVDTRPAWEQGGGGLNQVLKAFQLLSDEFNERFKGMWA